MAQEHSDWWRDVVVYQIYPRSFKDSNGDGIGDLRGIIEKLDYISSLGVDVIWLNPIFKSPNDDNGYDISDYESIMTEFGTMADFDELLSKMHERGLRLVLDLVVNHSSDEHPWFVEARKSRKNPYRDYYHWWPAEKGIPPKRYSYLAEGNDAWTYDETTDSYYLHYFSKKQPDLNWENPKLRSEIHSMMRFWFERGIDGFRMDVIPLISKDLNFPLLPGKTKNEFSLFYASGPKLHDYLRELNEAVLSKYDVMTVAEGLGVTTETALDFVDEDRRELNMLYHFEGMDVPKNDLAAFKEVYTKWDKVLEQKGQGTIYLGNHDQPRMVSRFGNDSDEFRELSSKLLTTFILTMRGTPYYYQGDELGMKNAYFPKLESYPDVEIRNLLKSGLDPAIVYERAYHIGRDNSRTPYPWDSTENGGFSSGVPWMELAPDFKEINAATLEKSNGSTLNYFRRLVKFRKEHKALRRGSFRVIDIDHPHIFAYERSTPEESLFILLNFSAAEVPWPFDRDRVLMNNDDRLEKDRLRPYQALILS